MPTLVDFSQAMEVIKPDFSVNIAPTMTGYASPSPYVVTHSSVYSSSFPTWTLFDRKDGISNGWCTRNIGGSNITSTVNEWAQLDVGAGRSLRIKGYGLKNRGGIRANTDNSAPPKSWQLLGSNDGSNFDVLDTHTDEELWEYGLTTSVVKNFTLTRVAEYRYYRLAITKFYVIVPLSSGIASGNLSELLFYA